MEPGCGVEAYQTSRLVCTSLHSKCSNLQHTTQQTCLPDMVTWLLLLPAATQIAANDDICKAFNEAGGVAALQQLLTEATDEGPAEVVRGAAAALRQLANSDAVKSQLAEAGALATIMRCAQGKRNSNQSLRCLHHTASMACTCLVLCFIRCCCTCDPVMLVVAVGR